MTRRYSLLAYDRQQTFNILFHLLVLCAQASQNVPFDAECKENSCDHPILVTSETGILSSPEYKTTGYYPDGADCYWCLESRGEPVTVLIDSTDIEFSENCTSDYLQLSKGFNDDEDALISRICGRSGRYEPIITNATEVLVSFVSDSTFNGRGFKLAYTTGGSFNREVFHRDCNSNVTAEEGEVSSPYYPETYRPGQDCWTLVNAPRKDDHLYLTFDVLSLQPDQGRSEADYLEILDGNTKDSPVLSRIYSKVTGNPKIRSSGSSLLLHFHSDDFEETEGFLGRFSVYGYDGLGHSEGECIWKRNPSGEGGYVTSPDYPEDYPKNSQCRVSIVAPPDQRIILNVREVKMEIDDACQYDKLEVRDGFYKDSLPLGVFCGIQRNVTLRSTGRHLSIHFVSDDQVQAKGFVLEYGFEDRTQQESENPKSISLELQKTIETWEDFLQTEVTALEGQLTELQCYFQRNATITWFIDDKEIESGQGVKISPDKHVLEFPSVQKSDQGVYRCTLDFHGTILTHSIILTILTEDSACNHSITIPPLDQTISEGDTVHLLCGSSELTDQVSWLKNGASVEANGTEDGLTLLSNGILYFGQVSHLDQGVYTCVSDKHKCRVEASAVLIVKKRKNWKQIEKICGWSRQLNKKAKGKIVGGHYAEKGAHPWQVMFWNETRKLVFCGGVMLNERWVLSAAHCFQHLTGRNYNEVRIKFGKLFTNQTEPRERQTVIQFVVIHPEFNDETLDNDIAMVRTRDHVSFSISVVPICIKPPEFTDKVFSASPRRRGNVTGWGVTHSVTEAALQKAATKLRVSRVLKEVSLPIVDHKSCNESWDQEVTLNMFCAGDKQETEGDSCKGDSGGPLVVKEGNVSVLVGLVSWGEGCAQKDRYGIYTKVSRYYDWILSLGSQ